MLHIRMSAVINVLRQAREADREGDCSGGGRAAAGSCGCAGNGDGGACRRSSGSRCPGEGDHIGLHRPHNWL